MPIERLCAIVRTSLSPVTFECPFHIFWKTLDCPPNGLAILDFQVSTIQLLTAQCPPRSYWESLGCPPFTESPHLRRGRLPRTSERVHPEFPEIGSTKPVFEIIGKFQCHG